jgi:hypothetical protein
MQLAFGTHDKWVTDTTTFLFWLAISGPYADVGMMLIDVGPTLHLIHRFNVGLMEIMIWAF